MTNVKIVRAHRVGGYYEGRERPIVFKLEDEKVREEILKRKSRLKNTQIYIEEDFTAKMRETRRCLREAAKKVRENGKRTAVRLDRLIIDGQRYRWNAEKKDIEMERTNRGPKNGWGRGRSLAV